MPETLEESLRKANEQQAQKIKRISDVLKIVAIMVRRDELLWNAVVDPSSGATLGKLLTGALDLDL